MVNVSYEGVHSITFRNSAGESRNTWTDWGLIPSSRHSEPASGIWSNPVDIPGINGQEDLVRMYPCRAVNSYYMLRSEVENDRRDYILFNYGYDIYQAGNGNFSFIIADQEESFHAKMQKILNFLHNQPMTMTFSDDSSKTYHVRTSISGYNVRRDFSSININYSVISEN